MKHTSAHGCGRRLRAVASFRPIGDEMNKTNAPIFDAVLSHLRATGELPDFGGPVEARLSLMLHSGGGCSPDVFELSWANQSQSIIGIDPAIADAWDAYKATPDDDPPPVEETIYREGAMVEFLLLLTTHWQLQNRRKRGNVTNASNPGPIRQNAS